jgi:hypothetical protein
MLRITENLLTLFFLQSTEFWRQNYLVCISRVEHNIVKGLCFVCIIAYIATAVTVPQFSFSLTVQVLKEHSSKKRKHSV